MSLSRCMRLELATIYAVDKLSQDSTASILTPLALNNIPYAYSITNPHSLHCALPRLITVAPSYLASFSLLISIYRCDKQDARRCGPDVAASDKHHVYDCRDLTYVHHHYGIRGGFLIQRMTPITTCIDKCPDSLRRSYSVSGSAPSRPSPAWPGGVAYVKDKTEHPA